MILGLAVLLLLTRGLEFRYLGETMDRESAQRFYRSAIAAILLTAGLFQQGCLAVAWVAAVGADSTRTSHITFRPFEDSWVSAEKPGEITDGPSLSSIAVLPVEGDPDMGRHLAQILQQETTLRVEPATRVAQEPDISQPDETGRGIVAKEIAQAFAVDVVLFGHVTGLPAHQAEWGWKEEESRRLFLFLVDRDGHMLWKDELPFTVVTGSKPPLAGVVQASLSQHLMEHVRDLGLDTLGYLPQKTS